MNRKDDNGKYCLEESAASVLGNLAKPSSSIVDWDIIDKVCTVASFNASSVETVSTIFFRVI